MLFVSTVFLIHYIVALQSQGPTENVAHILLETFRGAPDLPDSRRQPHRCPIPAVDTQPCKLAHPKPLTRGVYALGLGMWSAAVNHML